MANFTPQQVAAARAVIQRMLDKQKRLNFKTLEVEIRAVLDDPGASYEDVVEFFAACGLMIKLGSVHQFCIPRNIRPAPARPDPSRPGSASVLRRRPRA